MEAIVFAVFYVNIHPKLANFRIQNTEVLKPWSLSSGSKILTVRLYSTTLLVINYIFRN